MSVLAELRPFLDRELPAHRVVHGTRSDFEARIAWQRRLASGRWAGLSWPVEHGGRGLGILDRLSCDTELALRDAPVVAGLLGLNNVAPAIIAFGSPEQAAHLPRILDATEIWCQGFSEPDAGSDLAALRTVATVSDDGFEITGRKVWTSNGMDASHCMALVRTEPGSRRHSGISVLLLPLDLPGIERRPIHQMDGGAEFAEITFDGVRAPLSSLLGPLHDGWRITMTTLAHERAAVISQTALLERDTRAEVERWRGTTDVLLRQELAQRYIEGRVLGMLGAKAMASLAPGDVPGPEHSLIRLAQGLLRQRLANTRADALGPATVGGGAEDVARELLASRSVSIAAGTREVLKTVLAERVLGLPKG